MYDEKKYPNLTKSEALILAHRLRKLRDPYDKSKGSMYNSWRAKIYTDKGKKIGFPDSWKTFNLFQKEMSDGWKRGKILIRRDVTKPYSKENCFWGNKGEETLSKLCTLEYNNETKTLLEWSQIYNLNYCGIKIRFYHSKYKQYTAEEILFGRKRKQKRVITDKHELCLLARRNKLSKMLSSYRNKDRRKGRICNLTIEELDKITNQPCIYCGSTKNIELDRIDNLKGHTIDNVLSCCCMCNTTRNSNFSVEEMKKIGLVIKQIIKERNDRN